MAVSTSRVDETLIVTIDRPPVNALDAAAIDDLSATFARVAAEPPPGGVVLTGAGDVFSAGVDTRAFASYDQRQRTAMFEAISAMTARLLAIAVPVVAAINGHALGGGLVLALCCDRRIVADREGLRFALSEARAGVPFPEGPLDIIRHELPPGLLRQLTLTSEPVASADLLRERVFDALCPASDLSAAAVAEARRLANQPAFGTVKRQVRGRSGRSG